ncbi:MAG: hypothetical protein LC685_05640 [Actinobacteria bacterium]|nr:hypothetical protein [Actinomycetota bacterium]
MVIATLREQAQDDNTVVVATHDPRMIDVCSRMVHLEAGRLLETTP